MPRIRMPGIGNLELRRILVLPGGRIPMGTVIIEKRAITPLLRHQHEAAVQNADPPRKLGLQATQPDRRVEAPGSEVIRVDREVEHGTHREAAARSAWHDGHGHMARRKSNA